jgi:single-stranded DNA-binding protein
MSFSLNKQMIVGNLGRDPEIIQRGDFRIGGLNVATTEGQGDRRVEESCHLASRDPAQWRR